jgi:hypothetical protein
VCTAHSKNGNTAIISGGSQLSLSRQPPDCTRRGREEQAAHEPR